MNRILKNNQLMGKLFIIFLALHPIIDLVTSIMTRYIDFPISVGIIIRGLFILFLFIFMIFENKSKYKKYSDIFLMIYVIFVLLYFITKPELLKPNFLFQEIVYFFKYSYFPISFIGILNFIDHYKIKFNKIENIIVLNYIEVILSIIIAKITNTSFSTYNGNGKGSMGWFFSGNEISSYITILSPYLCIYFNNKKNFKYYIFVVISIIVSLTIGTKTSYLGALIPLILFLIFFVIKWNKKMILCYASFIALFFLFSNSTAVFSNFSKQLNTNKHKTHKKPNVVVVLNNRDMYLKKINKIYVDAPITEKIIGIGFVNRESINNDVIIKLIEMDPFDIFYRYGAFGFILFIFPYIAFAYISIIKLFKNKLFLNEKFLALCYIVCISAMVSLSAGHVLGAPMVSIYISIVIAKIYQEKFN